MKEKKLFENFLNTLDCQSDTRVIYRAAFQKFLRWMETNQLQSINLDAIHGFKVALENGDLNFSTANRYYAIIRSFAHTSLAIPKNKILQLRPQRPIEFKEQRLLTAKKALDLIEALDNSDLQGKRNLAIISLTVFNGLNSKQLSEMNVKDFLDITDPEIFIHSLPTYLRLHAIASNALRSWIREKERYSVCDPIFVQVRGDKPTPKRLSSRMIQRTVNQILQKQFQDPTITFSTLRQSAYMILRSMQMEVGEIYDYCIFNYAHWKIYHVERLPTQPILNQKHKVSLN